MSYVNKDGVFFSEKRMKGIFVYVLKLKFTLAKIQNNSTNVKKIEI